ncbi:MAG: ATPase, T2SS/T4P/T4SS family [Candidatus Omnitrophica bacterium]|nr:ATPase, T2SS/T4P/T4SS family [Candidatus Omnitrophota bacterium]MDD5352136.1 ATPase, T2SS/T4P/T4SS family [Candidatus Omnitrophota bacterium]MDD5549734.1 ATPase, T2SS/T4P/T4SS family [Candidatus Omnitrophota bacterium]
MHSQQSVIELLVKKGMLDNTQVSEAMKEAKRIGIPVEKALEKLGFISETEITQVLADSLGVPFMDLTDYLIDSEVIKLVPEAVAKRYKAVPLFKIGDSLTVAMADPQDITAIDEIRIKSKVGVVDPVLSTPDMIQKVIDQYYGAIGNAEELVKGLTKEKLEEKVSDTKGMSGIVEDTSIIKLVNLIIMQAVKDRASDIHIEPEEDKVRIRYRIDGILHEIQNIPKHLQSVLASRIKVMANMDIAETRNPQDGRIQLKMENKNLDLRISSFPTVHGENLVLRILDKTSVLLGLPELGFSSKDLKNFEKAIKQPNGIVLVTGPTGSGKTTTLYAALSTINSVEKNIITIEDPVEYEIPMIRQTQVNPKAGLTFANGLRSILRQDPDIVMVGEIRDRETADIAVRASLTGHLVFSTLHTNDAAGALTRLLDMGIEPFLISSSVLAILAQRLVRVICPNCKEKYVPSEEVISDLKLTQKIDFYRGKGCMRCKNTGFSGRIGIFELLVMNEELKNMVTAKMSAKDIRNKAVSLGMCTLFEDGMQKVKDGVTTVEEVLRVSEES